MKEEHPRRQPGYTAHLNPSQHLYISLQVGLSRLDQNLKKIARPRTTTPGVCSLRDKILQFLGVPCKLVLINVMAFVICFVDGNSINLFSNESASHFSQENYG